MGSKLIASLVVSVAALASPVFGASKYVESSDQKLCDACDAVIDRLSATYGTPKSWAKFPVYLRRYTGNGVAGYTQYSANGVIEVVVYESLDTAIGGTLDHELTHAFFFFLLQSNFDLCLNEGLAQNSEYKRRGSLRQTVYRRYVNGEFWSLDNLIGRNSYDNNLRLYHEGFSVVDFLIGRGGSKWFAAFLDDFNKCGSIDASLRKYYGYKDLRDFETAWRSYIEEGQDRLHVKAVR